MLSWAVSVLTRSILHSVAFFVSINSPFHVSYLQIPSPFSSLPLHFYTACSIILQNWIQFYGMDFSQENSLDFLNFLYKYRFSNEIQFTIFNATQKLQRMQNTFSNLHSPLIYWKMLAKFDFIDCFFKNSNCKLIYELVMCYLLFCILRIQYFSNSIIFSKFSIRLLLTICVWENVYEFVYSGIITEISPQIDQHVRHWNIKNEFGFYMKLHRGKFLFCTYIWTWISEAGRKHVSLLPFL